jgi:hypothetical protein
LSSQPAKKSILTKPSGFNILEYLVKKFCYDARIKDIKERNKRTAEEQPADDLLKRFNKSADM